MVYDERGTMFGEDVFKEPVEKNISVHFQNRFTIIPGRRTNKTVIRPLLSPVKKGAPKAILLYERSLVPPDKRNTPLKR